MWRQYQQLKCTEIDFPVLFSSGQVLGKLVPWPSTLICSPLADFHSRPIQITQELPVHLPMAHILLAEYSSNALAHMLQTQVFFTVSVNLFSALCAESSHLQSTGATSLYISKVHIQPVSVTCIQLRECLSYVWLACWGMWNYLFIVVVFTGFMMMFCNILFTVTLSKLILVTLSTFFFLMKMLTRSLLR